MDLLIVPFYNILFVYTWNDFSWLIMCDYTVWIVFYDLFALSENDEIKMINHIMCTEVGRISYSEIWTDPVRQQLYGLGRIVIYGILTGFL